MEVEGDGWGSDSGSEAVGCDRGGGGGRSEA